jgi:hypothetical protein
MKLLFLFPLLISIVLPCNAQLYIPQDCQGPMPQLAAPSCELACVPCDGIDYGYVGTNTAYGDISAFPPGFCAPQLHSPSFHTFIAGSTFIILEVFPFDCWFGDGIQVGVYTTDDCMDWIGPFHCNPSLPEGASDFIFLDGLLVGKTYYIVVDGYLGDVCDYQINVINGTTVPPPISGIPQIQGPDMVCEGAYNINYTVDGVTGTDVYLWELDGVVVELGAYYHLPYNMPVGEYQLCATPYSPCDTSGITACMTIKVDALPLLVEEVDICEEDFPYNTGDGFIFPAPGVYEYVVFDSEGCRQEKMITLNALSNYSIGIDTAICFGEEPFELGGQLFTQTGTYQVNLQSTQGCDSIITLNLTAQPPAFTNLGIITSNEWIIIGDSLITMPGYFEVIDETVIGCDSIILGVLEISALDTVLQDTVLCEGDSLFIDNMVYVTDTIHYDSIFNGNTFDTLIQTQIVFLPNTDTLLLDTLCTGETYVLGDSVYTESGIYEYIFVADNGCDSTVSLQLAVLQPFDTITATICEGEAYTFGGADLSTTGIYVDTLQGPTGCESIVQLELSVLPAFETIISEVICEGDTLVTANLALYENGTYTDTLAAINGCDSMLLIDLTVHPAPVTLLNESICEGGSITIDGQVFTQGGDYTLPYTTVEGCDSTVILSLAILPEGQDTLALSICEGDTLTLHGDSYTNAGIYEQILTGANGCDSVLTVLLEVLPLDTTVLDINVCEGECYSLGSTPYCQPGVYQQMFTGVDGCDSLVILALDVLPVSYVVLDTAICPGDAYVDGDIYIDSEGAYNFVLAGQNGCDSIVDIIITFLPDSFTDLQIEICEGDAYTVGDSTYTETGQYIIPFENGNASGCDSTVLLALEVTPAVVTSLDTTLCFGETLDIGPYAFISEVDDEFLEFVDADNCLSYVQLNLSYYEAITLESVTIIADEGEMIPTGEIAIQLAGGTPPYQYLWSNGRVTNEIDLLEAGDYFLIVTDAAECQEVFYFTVPYDPGLLPEIMSEQQDDFDILVYPNPFGRYIEVQLPPQFEGEALELQMLDFAGRVHYHAYGTSTRWTLSPDLPAGIYWLTAIRGGIQIGVARVVKIN